MHHLVPPSGEHERQSHTHRERKREGEGGREGGGVRGV
jgi:hypothetical protein